jgi:hypothetical protein
MADVSKVEHLSEQLIIMVPLLNMMTRLRRQTASGLEISGRIRVGVRIKQ